MWIEINKSANIFSNNISVITNWPNLNLIDSVGSFLLEYYFKIFKYIKYDKI